MKAKAIATLSAAAITLGGALLTGAVVPKALLTAAHATPAQSTYATPAQSLYATPAFNSTSVRAVISKAGIWRLCPETSVSVFGSTVAVSLYRHSKSSETDLKIDAVLMAHALSKNFDQMFTELRVHYFKNDGQESFSTVFVPTLLVREYGSGAISQATLLSSLRVSKDRKTEVPQQYRVMTYQQMMAPSVVVGDYMRKERQDLWFELEGLERQGFDITASRGHALAMEDAARRHDWNAVKRQYAIVKTMIPGRLRASNHRTRKKFTASKTRRFIAAKIAKSSGTR